MFVHDRVYKSLKLWTLYCDLEESIGTFDSAKTCYNRIIDGRLLSFDGKHLTQAGAAYLGQRLKPLLLND